MNAKLDSWPRLATLLLLLAPAAPSAAQQLLDPATQPRWVNPLPVPEAYSPRANPKYPSADYYEIQATQFRQWLGLYHPRTPGRKLLSTVWGYGPVGGVGSYPGRTIQAARNRPAVVKWINNLTNPDGTPLTRHLLESRYDLTLHGTNAQEPHVRMVVHNHGAEVRSDSDGYPDFWFTPDRHAPPNGMGGPAGNSALYTYPNQQPPTTLWYHDHSLGMTRLNVYAGMAGFYLISDPATEGPLNLPSGRYEIPLLIQDKMFWADGSLAYETSELYTPNDYHPLLPPEFMGSFILVNGMAWPYLNVEPRKYRFRMLNGSNARMYNLRLVDQATGDVWPKVYQIGGDDGYLEAPVRLEQASAASIGDGDITDASNRLFLANAERVDVVVDFSGAKPGQTLLLTNDAPYPFPGGDDTDPATNGSILQLRVVAPAGPDSSALPRQLNPLPTRIPHDRHTPVRRMVITEIEDPVNGTPTVALINNTCWERATSEFPAEGTTEIWEIVNLTPDTHPIHLHLVAFNLLDRQQFDKNGYMQIFARANGSAGSVISGDAALDDGTPVLGPPPDCPASVSPDSVGVGGPGNVSQPVAVPDVTPFLQGPRLPPNGTEAALKDTVRVKHGTVTRLVVRFSPQDPRDATASGLYKAFDPSVGQYVIHCHILEHEDNDMMRAYKVVSPARSTSASR